MKKLFLVVLILSFFSIGALFATEPSRPLPKNGSPV